MLSIRETARELIDPIVLRIQSRTHGRVRDLRVERNGEQIILRGRVATYHTKQLAQHGALDAPVDMRLINKIVVG
ncbi:MAG: phospholipid-binding protein [Isosphaeraceae bacterium]